MNFGTINEKAAIFPCSIDEDSRGLIWISSYGTADLTSFNPENGEFTRYGRLDEVDMYAYCYVNTDDTVASMIMQTRPHVVVLDPKTGEKRTVGPVVTRGEGTLTLHRGEDGNLYIESSEGNFRLEGMNAVPVEETVPAEGVKPALPDGSTFRFVDAAEQTCRILEVTGPDGAAKTFNIEFEAAGIDIFCLHGGPDGCVYGSSVLPERMFRFDPGKDDLTDLGICSTATGEAYSMANLEGKIYISSYPGARISIYDPAQPYRFGESRGSNPWDIGRVDNISYRPRSTLGGPGGKVWLASIPDYGRWGGPAFILRPGNRGEKGVLSDCGRRKLLYPGASGGGSTDRRRHEHQRRERDAAPGGRGGAFPLRLRRRRESLGGRAGPAGEDLQCTRCRSGRAAFRDVQW